MTFLVSLMGLVLMLAEEGEQFEFGLYKVVKSLTIPGWIVVVILILQSIYLIAIGIERWLTYNKARTQSRAYAPKVAQALKNGNIEEAIAVGDKYKDSHLAMVVSSGLKEFNAYASDGAVSSVEMDASKRALDRAIAIKTAELKRGLAGLATIGSTAPFVGLFGTVVGILNAFVELAKSETAGIGAVGGAIAEALVATAFGIAVAVPAVWLFNYFTSKVTGFGVEMENSASELVDYFIKQNTQR